MNSKRLFLFGIIVVLLLACSVRAQEAMEVECRVKPLVEQDGLLFGDLNNNGVLDPYEDWRLSPEERARDLLSQMTLKEKAAQMQHPTFVPRPDGSAPAFLEKWAKDLNVGFVLVRDLPSGRKDAETANQVQEWSEASRLGIPILISMDSVHGTSYVNGALVHPHNLGLAATRDPDLVRRLTEATREEHLAIGVRMTLSPVADIGTEPRWGRVMETFGEDPELVAKMVGIQVEAFQNGRELNSRSVLTTAKHFPGSGPQMEGVDMAPIVASLEAYDLYHLAALGSKPTLQDLLRQKLGFTGIITTDWGMIWGIQQSGSFIGGEISDDEAIVIGVENARVDGIGGESIRLIDDMVRLVEAGLISEASIDDSVYRILLAKFKMGIFDNPYVDPDYAEQIVGCPEHQALSLEAALKSMTLLKNDGLLPLKPSGNILVAGSRAADMDSLTGGWSSGQDGKAILDVIRERVGDAGTVFYEGENPETAASLAQESDVAVVVIGEPAYMHSPPWGAQTLEITPMQQELLTAIHETGTPIVVVVMMGRPYILTWCAENTSAILVAYYPGTQGAVAIADVLFGGYNPQGKLPIQIPRNMEQVRAQKSDIPFDIADPLYDFGFGLSYE